MLEPRNNSELPVIPTTVWGDTSVLLPEHLSAQVFTDALIELPGYQVPSGRLMVADLLAGFPLHIASANCVPVEARAPLKPLTASNIPIEGEVHDEHL